MTKDKEALLGLTEQEIARNLRWLRLVLEAWRLMQNLDKVHFEKWQAWQEKHDDFKRVDNLCMHAYLRWLRRINKAVEECL